MKHQKSYLQGEKAKELMTLLRVRAFFSLIRKGGEKGDR